MRRKLIIPQRIVFIYEFFGLWPQQFDIPYWHTNGKNDKSKQNE